MSDIGYCQSTRAIDVGPELDAACEVGIRPLGGADRAGAATDAATAGCTAGAIEGRAARFGESALRRAADPDPTGYPDLAISPPLLAVVATAGVRERG